MTRRIRWLRPFTFKKSVLAEPPQWAEVGKPMQMPEFGDFEHVFQQGEICSVLITSRGLMMDGIGTIEDAVLDEDFEIID